MPKIAIGEVATSLILPKHRPVYLDVSDEFLQQLRKSPKKMPYGYAWGKPALLQEGEYVGQHGNDVALTGILDVTGITSTEYKTITDYDRWRSIYETKKRWKRWNDRSCLKRVQKEISPRIIFLGENYGGDVGTEVLVRRNSKGVVEALVLLSSQCQENAKWAELLQLIKQRTMMEKKDH